MASWPKSSFENNFKQHTDITWEHIYNSLSYFNIKYFTPWIKGPMLTGIGVQDKVCPTYINFAACNKVPGSRKWIAYGNEGHKVGSDFYLKRLAFSKNNWAWTNQTPTGHRADRVKLFFDTLLLFKRCLYVFCLRCFSKRKLFF